MKKLNAHEKAVLLAKKAGALSFNKFGKLGGNGWNVKLGPFYVGGIRNGNASGGFNGYYYFHGKGKGVEPLSFLEYTLKNESFDALKLEIIAAYPTDAVLVEIENKKRGGLDG